MPACQILNSKTQPLALFPKQLGERLFPNQPLPRATSPFTTWRDARPTYWWPSADSLWVSLGCGLSTKTVAGWSPNHSRWPL